MLKSTATSPAAVQYFAEINEFGLDMAAAGDVVTEWLNSPPLVNVLDPIAWWTAMDKAGHTLAPMALDFLSAPGMSVSVP